MSVNSIPDGFHTVTPYLVVADVPRLIEFLKHAFGATEVERTLGANGRVMHAQVRMGTSIVMIGGAMDGFPAAAASLYLYVPDTDTAYKRALDAGAVSLMEPAHMFYGDRSAGVEDVGGNKWWIATHVEDVSPEECQRRAREFRGA